MNKILLIYSGGTIGMIKKNKSLEPFDFNEIRNAFPELSDSETEIDHTSIKKPIDSSNMTIDNWIEIANCIKENYIKYNGFVILHGSDTMAYTSSALSFMLENINKAVILTGSQLPIGIKRTDAKENLITAIEIAGSGIINEVCVYFEYQLYRGSRVTKINADNFDAFQSPNYPILAKAGINIKYKKQYLKSNSKDHVKFHLNLSNNVSILKMFPSIRKKVVTSILNSSKGIILETYGSGNATTENWFIRELEIAINNGKTIINVSQCLSGSVTQGHYQTSKELERVGVISAKDMTTEAAVTKLMLVLAKSFDKNEIKKKILENFSGELTL